MLENAGWRHVVVKPSRVLDQYSSSHIRLHSRFSDPLNEMNVLSVYICATKD
jgi:hypothetical protein